MKRYWLPGLFCLVVSGTTTSAAEAEAPQTRTLSRQDVIEMAVQHNLDVQIARYNPQMAIFSLQAAYGGYDPSLTLGGQHDNNSSGPQVLSGGFIIPAAQSDDNRFSSSLGGLAPWGMSYSLQGNSSDSYGRSGNSAFENSGGLGSISVTQPLLKNFWIDNTRLTIRVAKNRLKYSELALKSQIMTTATGAEQAYYDLIYARENVLVQKKAVELAQRLVEENKKRVEVGAMAPLDEQQAEYQAATSQAALIAAESALSVQENVLRQLMTDRYSEWQPLMLVPSGTLTAVRQFPDLQLSWTKGLTQRPEFLQAKLDLERAGLQLKFAKNQLYPELDVFATAGYNGSGREFSDALFDMQNRNRPFYTYGGRMTVPLSNTAARNNYKNTKAAEAQLVLTLKKLEQSIMIQIDNDIKQIRSNFQQVEATRAAREYQEAALAAEQKKLENGKSTTYTVLQNQRDLTAARGNEIQALDNYNKSLSQLSLDEGSTLDRLGIDLEVK